MKNLQKKLILTDGNGNKVVYGTVEDAIYKYANKAVEAFARKCIKSLAWTHNGLDLEDYEQIARMEIVQLFEIYDEIHSFSSLYNTKMDQLYIHLLRYYGNQKRSMEDSNRAVKEDGEKRVSYKPLELNSMYDEDKEYTEVIGFLSEEMMSIEYKLAIEKCLEIFDEKEKEILAFLIEEDEAKFNFAKRIGLSRPTLNKKIDYIRETLKTYLEIA